MVEGWFNICFMYMSIPCYMSLTYVKTCSCMPILWDICHTSSYLMTYENIWFYIFRTHIAHHFTYVMTFLHLQHMSNQLIFVDICHEYMSKLCYIYNVLTLPTQNFKMEAHTWTPWQERKHGQQSLSKYKTPPVKSKCFQGRSQHL